MWRSLFFFTFLSTLPQALLAQDVDLEEQVRRIASQLRCVVCQNLSIADSPSELAQQMRGLIREQLQQGKNPEEIKAYFVSKYGEWVLLAPQPKGFRLLVWVLPFIALMAGMLLVIFVLRRWVHKKKSLPHTTIDPALIKRVKQEAAAERPPQVDLEAENPRSLLLQEQARLYADLKELEFDYQAGRLSEADYDDLCRSLETQAATVLKELDSSPPLPKPQETAPKRKRTATQKETKKPSHRHWRLAAGGVFLLFFGITLGVFLTKSLRPRLSEMDTITGDFLTGTGPGGTGAGAGMAGMEMGAPSPREISSFLAQGRAAFERQEWSEAIEAFKKALAIDANQPEGHSYMGLILVQAGHADGALLAFDRALSSNPNFPLALWGKGMLLYRAKQDFSGARQTLEKLLTLLPPGNDRNEVQKTIAEVAQLSSAQKQDTKIARAEATQRQVRGTISIDPKLRTAIDSKTVLFIIARSASSTSGPPLAVKRIDRPVFPVSYSLGPEDVMIPGVPLTGKVIVSARLDKDGNPATREPGNLIGQYKKNPVEIGWEKVNIIIDQVVSPDSP